MTDLAGGAVPILYTLDEHKNVVPVRTMQERLAAYRWYEEPGNRRVAYHETGDTSVSTVFLIVDHRFDSTIGPPIVFETMVFGGPMDGLQWRYCTWDEAAQGHTKACAKVFA